MGDNIPIPHGSFYDYLQRQKDVDFGDYQLVHVYLFNNLFQRDCVVGMVLFRSAGEYFCNLVYHQNEQYLKPFRTKYRTGCLDKISGFHTCWQKNFFVVVNKSTFFLTKICYMFCLFIFLQKK